MNLDLSEMCVRAADRITGGHYFVRKVGAGGGVRVTVRTAEDDDSTPFDADCYSDADVASYHRGDWSYMGVVVQVEVLAAGVSAEESLWGIEHDLTDLDTERKFLAESVIPDLFNQACASIADAARVIADL